MSDLYSHVSGMAVPVFAVDLPGGKGKVPLTPQYLLGRKENQLLFRNYLGEHCEYPEVTGPSTKGDTN
jgi:lysine 2,3-aminomutase